MQNAMLLMTKEFAPHANGRMRKTIWSIGIKEIKSSVICAINIDDPTEILTWWFLAAEERTVLL